MNSISKYLLENRLRGCLWTSKHIECKDGFSISVQASEIHFCTPRNNKGPWTHFELFFNKGEYSDLCDSFDISSHTPLSVVESIIKEHGGIQPDKFEKIRRDLK